MPLRAWSIELHLVGPHGEDVPANCFEKVVYTLHETFEDRQVQTFKRAPFRINEQGWGEFDMRIALHTSDKSGDQIIAHDLNFQSNRYETKHPVTFKNPKGPLLAILKESGSLPGDANGVKSRDESAKKKKRPDKGVDMEKLAENLQRVGEDDLLLVVQMIHDNKGPDSWTKNDVEQGEFQVDLYTLPDDLIRQLWDFTVDKVRR
ncbi:transcription factor TFIIF complex subunit Tfg3 [Lecanora helva]